ncbi:MAG: nitrite reductase large subunit NirB, partial [Acidimicrobiales bacterium]
ELSLCRPSLFSTPGLRLHLGESVSAIDRAQRTVTSSSGRRVPYDTLVLATGSAPFVPPIPGTDAAGCFVYRTIDDVEAIRAWAARCGVGVVIGGGLLGLEAANALLSMGLTTHVVELAPRLMPLQVDDGGGRALRRQIEALGVSVHTGSRSAEVLTWAARARSPRRVSGIRLDDASDLVAGIVVFSAGIRPRDELARGCGLAVGERGGVSVDSTCATSDPSIFAIGECAHVAGRTWGLVSPGYQMARVVADRITGVGDACFTGADPSTKLKLLGVDVASFGDAQGDAPGAEALCFSDARSNIYRKLVVDVADGRVLGGVLVGDASGYTQLAAMAQGNMSTPDELASMVLPAGALAGAGARQAGMGSLSGASTICNCENVCKDAICAAIAAGAGDVAGVKAATRAGTGCGACVPLLADLLADAGVASTRQLCEHFSYTRQELFDIVRVERIETFSEVLARHGRGRGCEVCKPAVAAMLASLDRGHILDGEGAGLQDTNDAFLANLQRDGTYSVVPRVPGGEITPEKLIVLGQVALEFGLYTKITGAQRVDLFGARVEQLPAIWARLVEAGFESGHAYGKALRTVKSCVGSTWCRYGVQDSTTLAIDLELRYRGLRSPHKLKSAVSGCTRECAEAQSKDFGVIATERGWNLYVCG